MKMLITRMLLFVLFLVTYATHSFATGIGLPSAMGDNDGGQGIYCLDSNNKTTLSLYVQLANLEELGTDINGTTIAGIPAEHPDMYVRYTVGGVSYLPIYLSPLTFTRNLLDVNGVPVYTSPIETFDLDFDGECQANGGGIVQAPVTIEILTKVNNNYVLYPACLYSGSAQIFSCQVFDHAGDCNGTIDGGGSSSLIENRPPDVDAATNRTETGPGGDCNNTRLTYRSLSVRYYCFIPGGPCDDPDPCGEFGNPCDESEDPDNRPDDRNNSSDFDLNSTRIQASPNPFLDHLKLQWSDKANIEALVLYDVNGKEIRYWNKSQVEASSSLNVNTNTLRKGIYFLRVQSEASTEVIKVVKQ